MDITITPAQASDDSAQNANTTSDASGTTQNPDSQTVDRIKNLAFVGTALNQTASDKTFHTNFYIAKESLLRFKQGIERLNLDQESYKGMVDLVDYLDKKIDRRITNADTTGDKPLT